MAINERPGVYSSYYVVQGEHSGIDSGVNVGIIAASESGNTGVERIGDRRSAAILYGTHSSMYAMICAALTNGCRSITAVAAEDGYTQAIAAMAAVPDIDLIVCDSDDASVHAALKAAIGADGERIGIVTASGSASEMCERAAALNCERIVLLDAPAEAAAAFAGCIASNPDPAVSLSGKRIMLTDTTEKTYTDTQVNLLVRGGVTPVECVDGVTYPVRAVTTRTVTDGEPDSSLRELGTVRIINIVVPTVRSALRAMFTGARNDARTRGAIRTQVILELERLKKRGYIEAYGDVSAVPDSTDATVCAVSFGFQPAYALEFIELTAVITV